VCRTRPGLRIRGVGRGAAVKNSLFVTLTSVGASTPIAPTNGLVAGR
jgi:hypothetical protein